MPRVPSARWARTTGVTVAATILALSTLAAPAGAAAPTGRYAALGDSYAAGVLIPNQSAGLCLRSDHDYGHLVAARLRSTATADATCGGAVTDDMTRPQSGPAGTVNGPQFDALTADTRLVSVTIGGNDIGFADIAATCVALGVTDHAGSPCRTWFQRTGSDEIAARVQATAAKVTGVLAGIHARSPLARVLLVGYPTVLSTDGWACQASGLPVAVGDVGYLHDVVVGLNAMLARAAAANTATYVDTAAPTVGHDLCQAPGARWIEALVPLTQAAPIHPNLAGQEAMARAVLAALGNPVPTPATGQLTGKWGLCADVAAGSVLNGTPVGLWSCHGQANQQWTVADDGSVRALGKCLDVAGGGTWNGNPVQLWDCNFSGAQQWRLRSDGTLYNPRSGKCLDSPAGFGLQIWDCWGFENQRWHLPS